MSDANVVAQTIESTLDRQARTRESYEQEIASLSSQVIELRSALEFVQTAIDLKEKFEREEDARLAVHQEELDALAAEAEKEARAGKDHEDEIKEAERIVAQDLLYNEALTEDWHRQQVALDAEAFKKRKEFYEKELSGQAHMEQVMVLLQEVKGKK